MVKYMLKKILIFVKRVIFSFFLLYAYNILVEPINLNIPINFITVGSLSILGVPALVSLIIISVVIF